AKAREQIRTIRYLRSAGSVARAIKPTVDTDRRAGRQSEDPVELPAGKHFSSGSGHVACEREVVGVVQGEVVADVDARQAPIRPPIVRVLRHSSAYIQIPTEYAVRIVGVSGVRVRSLQLESGSEASVEANLQGVIL